MSSANNYEEEFTMDNAFRSNNNNSAMKQQDDNTQSPSSNGSNDSNTSNNMVTLQLNTDTSSAERFSVWMGLTVFSMICLIALQSRRGLFDADTAGEVWVVAVFVLSFLLSLSAVVAYLLVRSIFVGHVPEIALIVLLVAFWSAGLPTIMNPANDIAVSPADSTVVGTVVTNANLYFFAWLSFGCAVSLTGSMAQEYITLFSTNTNNNPRMSLLEATRKAGRWYALTATTIIMTGTAVRDFQVTSCRDSVEPNADDDEDEEDTNRVAYCRRSRFAIAMGMIGLTMAATMTAYLTKQHMSSTTVRPLTVAAETGVTTLQLVLWCFGVGYITFGKSPGSTIGNLYFSTWISFILAVFLFATSFRELVATRAAAAAAAQQQQQEDSNDAPNNTNGRQGSIMPPQPEFDDM